MSDLFPATAMPDSDWWNALWPEPAAVLISLGIAGGQDAVDLCCGAGLFTAALARIVRSVVAIDIDVHLLALARVRTAAANCTFVERDAYDVAAAVPWPADFVLMANTFHGVPEKERLTSDVASVLKPDGRFAIVNWHRRPREETVVLGKPRGPPTSMRMAPDDVAAAVKSAGFRLAQLVELPPYHYGAVFRRSCA